MGRRVFVTPETLKRREREKAKLHAQPRKDPRVKAVAALVRVEAIQNAQAVHAEIAKDDWRASDNVVMRFLLDQLEEKAIHAFIGELLAFDYLFENLDFKEIAQNGLTREQVQVFREKLMEPLPTRSVT